jgi:6-phosphofructokinase 2
MPEHKLRTTFVEVEPGGGGVNVSRVLHRFGTETEAVLPVGGMASQELVARLQNDGIPVRSVPVGADTRRSVTVFETDTGDHYRFVGQGRPLTEPEWRAFLLEVAIVEPHPDYVVLSGSFPPGVPADFVAELAAVARGFSARLVVDTSGEPLAAAVDAGVFLAKPNRRELAYLVGHEGPLADVDHESAARRLHERGVEIVVVSLGADGASLLHESRSTSFRSPPVDVVSTVGAGDSMLAGILHGFGTRRDVVEAVRLGVAAGAAACVTPGSELCRPDDAYRLEAEVQQD